MSELPDDTPDTGQGAGKKPTREEMEDRIEYTAWLLCRRLLKGDIKRLLKRRYHVDARTCERYLSRAKERLVAKTGRTKDEHRIDSLNFYESVLNGPDANLRDRLDAQGRIDKLLGLEAPAKVAPTNPDGTEEYQGAVPTDKLLDKLLPILAAGGAGGGAGPNGPAPA